MSAAYANAAQLKQMLFNILQGEAPRYWLHCASAREAVALRSRLNKIRAADRKDIKAMYQGYNDQQRQESREGRPATYRILDSTDGISPFDKLVFIVRGADVIVEKGPDSIEDVMQFVTAEGQDRPAIAPRPEPVATEVPPAAEVPSGAHSFRHGSNTAMTFADDTAPRNDEDPFA